MYDAVEDPYCYPQTTVLKNLAGLRTQRALTRFETAMAAQRADEPLPIGRLEQDDFSSNSHAALCFCFSMSFKPGSGVTADHGA
jgi:cell filamentation protein